jgi:aryl-alcohol dehydrogenase-like predicted oxidoreductase
MVTRVLGSAGVRVSPPCLGAMTFGAWGNPDHDESVRIIHRALASGINFIDTADVYSAGESEIIVGKALVGGRRANVVLATKAHGRMGEDVNERGNSRRWLSGNARAACAASAPITSTCTRFTGLTRRRTSTRPWRRCRI